MKLGQIWCKTEGIEAKNAGNCRKLQLAEGKIESTHPNFAQAELPSTEVRKKRAYAGRMGAAK